VCNGVGGEKDLVGTPKESSGGEGPQPGTSEGSSKRKNQKKKSAAPEGVNEKGVSFREKRAEGEKKEP